MDKIPFPIVIMENEFSPVGLLFAMFFDCVCDLRFVSYQRSSCFICTDSVQLLWFLVFTPRCPVLYRRYKYWYETVQQRDPSAFFSLKERRNVEGVLASSYGCVFNANNNKQSKPRLNSPKQNGIIPYGHIRSRLPFQP